MSTTQAERYTAPALDKGLDILETLAEAEAGLTQAEIARRLDRSIRKGARIELWRTSSGWVVLAFQPGETIDRYLRDYPPPDGRSPSSERTMPPEGQMPPEGHMKINTADERSLAR